MSATIDEAICLRHWDWSETSQTVVLFTRGSGILRGLAKGAKRDKGKFSGGFDVLSTGEIGFLLKRESDLATLTEWDVRETFPRLRDNLEANRSGWYVADMLHRMLPVFDPHPVLYETTLHLLRSLQRGATPTPSLLRFQWSLLEETGWRPELTNPDPGAATLAFDPVGGKFLRDMGDAGHWRIRRGTLQALESLAVNQDPVGDEESLNRANRLLAAHLRNVLGEEPMTMAAVFGELPASAQKPTRSRSATR
ncbi:MAG: DNA repair protein RecO [Planctomycetes bacterium]|nr:DNA repair protein RecO [Planctomycetota bacterium]